MACLKMGSADGRNTWPPESDVPAAAPLRRGPGRGRRRLNSVEPYNVARPRPPAKSNASARATLGAADSGGGESITASGGQSARVARALLRQRSTDPGHRTVRARGACAVPNAWMEPARFSAAKVPGEKGAGGKSQATARKFSLQAFAPLRAN